MATTIYSHSTGSGYEAFGCVDAIPSGLIAIWTDGASHDADDQKVMGALSSDNGATWPSPFTIAQESGKKNASAGVFYNPGDGALLVAVIRQNNAGGGGAILEPKIYRSTSGGGSGTWSEYATLSVPSGYDWLYPYGQMQRVGTTIYWSFYGQKTSDGLYRAFIYKSDDNGATWSQHGTFHHDGTNHADEPCFCQVSGNDWLALVRRDAVPGGATSVRMQMSADGGVTWSDQGNFATKGVSPSVYRVSATEIYLSVSVRAVGGSPSSRIYLFLTTDGGPDAALVTGATSSGQYTTGISDDDFGYQTFANDNGTLKFAFYNSAHDMVYETWGVSIPAETFPQGRTTKNTRSAPLGVNVGMGWRMKDRIYVPPHYAPRREPLRMAA